MTLPTPYRCYAVGPVWRNEKPGPGRFRQFYQCDADTVGSGSVAADAEICAMLGEALEAAGIARGDYVVRINNRKVLNGVMEVAGVLDPADPEAHAARRGDRDAGDRQARPAGRGRGAGAARGRAAGRERGFHRRGRARRRAGGGDPRRSWRRGRGDAAATCARLRELVGGSQVGLEGVQELEAIAELLAARGASGVIDPSVVRGLGYYTGPVFEAELTFEVLDEDGRPRQFGSVAGGGRYDDLVRRFTGEAVPATGVSIGVDRLLAALGEKGRLTAVEAGPVVVTVMDRDRMAGYQAMAAELRAGGLRAEVFLGGGGMGRQLKYADQRGCGGRGDRGRRRAGARRGAAQGPGARGAAGGGDRDARGLAGAAGAGGGAARGAGRGGAGDAGAGGLMVSDRAYLKGARMGAALARLEAEVARILAVLGSTGAMRVEPAALQPADVLLDLYGEDIRARAFVTRDEGAEMMLRPDFTVPIVRLHMDGGRGAGALRLLRAGLAAAGVRLGPAAGVPAGGVRGLRGRRSGGARCRGAGADRRGAGRCAGRSRHRRPRAGAGGDRRARDQRGAQGGAAAARLAAGAVPRAAGTLRRGARRGAGRAGGAAGGGGGGADAGAGAAAGAAVGLRGAEEVAARVARLAEEAATPPLAGRGGGADRGGAGGRGNRGGGARAAAGAGARAAGARGGGRPASRRGSTRWRRAGSRRRALRFEASFGRTSLEYYDGFVFGALPRGRADLPPIASGGRYDALTRALGQGRGVPAVGGMIRPEALVALRGGGMG